MSSKPAVPLPDTLSGLLRLAVTDARKCAADPRYRLNMSVWHENEDGKCLVCLAGSIMAMTLGASPHAMLWPTMYEQDISDKLRAIDLMRIGKFAAAAHIVGIGEDLSKVQDDALCACDGIVDKSGGYGWEGDLSQYLECADLLEAVGL